MNIIVALVSDLIFQSKIAGTAEHLGIAVRVARTPEAALEALASASALIVDLNAAEPPPLELIRRVRSDRPGARILAFLPHVQVDLSREARAAGADQVLPRSKFSESLPAILTELSRFAGPAGDIGDSADA